MMVSPSVGKPRSFRRRWRSAIVLLFASLLLPGPAHRAIAQEWRDGTPIVYSLVRDRLAISGTVTRKDIPVYSGSTVTLNEAITRTAVELSLETEADPDARFRLSAEDGLLSSNTLELELSGKGTLVSSNFTSEGVLGKIVKGVFRAVVSVASAATPFRGATAEASRNPWDVLYETAHRDMHQRRAELRAALAAINTKIVGIELLIVDDFDPANPDLEAAKAAREGFMLLREIRDDLLAEAEGVEAHYKAWKARQENERTEPKSFVVEIDSLPNATPVRTAAGADLDALVAILKSDAGLSEAGEQILRELRVVPAITDVARPTSHPAPPTSASSYSGLFYRVPRPVELHLYRAVVTDSGAASLALLETTVIYVVDAHSEIAYLEFDRSNWAKRGVNATFAANGALHSLSRNTESELAGAVGTLADLPAEYAAALKQANDIIDQRQTIALQDTEFRVSELKEEKNLLQAQLDAQELLDGRETVAEIAAIEREIDLLEARSRLVDTQQTVDIAAEMRAVELARQLQELRNALDKAEIERASLQRQIQELKNAGQRE